MTDIPIAAIERQMRWEGQCNEDGVERYRRSLRETGLADAPPGQIAMRDMMLTLVPAMEERREEALAAFASGQAGRGTPQAWWGPILMLPADKLAFITARTVLTATSDRPGQGRPLTGAALRVATAVREELEFENWQAKEAAAAEADPRYLNLAKLIVARAGGADSRSFRRWKKKLKTIERFDWPYRTRVQLGVVLATLLVENSGGWFVMRSVRAAGKTEYRIFLTDEAVTAISDINSRLELMRPYFLPMLCPPKPWRHCS